MKIGRLLNLTPPLLKTWRKTNNKSCVIYRHSISSSPFHSSVCIMWSKQELFPTVLFNKLVKNRSNVKDILSLILIGLIVSCNILFQVQEPFRGTFIWYKLISVFINDNQTTYSHRILYLRNCLLYKTLMTLCRLYKKHLDKVYRYINCKSIPFWNHMHSYYIRMLLEVISRQ